MTAKVTLSFSNETIEDARRFARRDGVSLSAWIDRAARERTVRELFGAHAEAVKRAGQYRALEDAALADDQEQQLVHELMLGGRTPRAAQG